MAERYTHMKAGERPNYLGDGMHNVLSGLGGALDKGAANRHVLVLPSDHELTVAYESSWVAGQIVDIPVEDATKKWRAWEGEHGEAIQALERDLDVQSKVADAAKSARLYGGAALIVGAGSEDASEPLDIGQVDEIRYLNVLDRFDLSPGPIVNDVTSKRFNLPEHYSARVNGALQRVHPSRLCIFRGRKPASRTVSTSLAGWDNSVLVNKMDAVRDIDAVMAHIRNLIAEAKIDVIKTPDLTSRVIDPRQEAALKAQLSLLQQTVGNNRKVLLDSKEDFLTSTYQFAGLAEMVDRFMHMAAGAADIPITRLFGASPGGLNATGESDLSNYYDTVAAIQANHFAPALSPLDNCMKATVGALDDPSANFKWRPIKALGEKDIAEVQERTINALNSLAASQLFGDDQLAKAIAENALRVGITGLEEPEDLGGDLGDMEMDDELPTVSPLRLVAEAMADALEGSK